MDMLFEPEKVVPLVEFGKVVATDNEAEAFAGVIPHDLPEQFVSVAGAISISVPELKAGLRGDRAADQRESLLKGQNHGLTLEVMPSVGEEYDFGDSGQREDLFREMQMPGVNRVKAPTEKGYAACQEVIGHVSGLFELLA